MISCIWWKVSWRGPTRQGFRGPAEALLRLIKVHILNFLRGNGETCPLSFCASAAEVCKLVCNFSPFHTFLTFTCATPLNCTNIKRFLPLNTEKWREINNFWEFFALPGQKSRSFEVFSLTFTDFLSCQSKKSPPLIAFHRSPFILQPFSGCFFLRSLYYMFRLKYRFGMLQKLSKTW